MIVTPFSFFVLKVENCPGGAARNLKLLEVVLAELGAWPRMLRAFFMALFRVRPPPFGTMTA